MYKLSQLALLNSKLNEEYASYSCMWDRELKINSRQMGLNNSECFFQSIILNVSGEILFGIISPFWKELDCPK